MGMRMGVEGELGCRGRIGRGWGLEGRKGHLRAGAGKTRIRGVRSYSSEGGKYFPTGRLLGIGDWAWDWG
jgi:hypothetical protein